MDETVTIKLLGEPKGKGRPRFSQRSGHAYTPSQTRAYEMNLAYAAQVAMQGRKPMEGPLEAVVKGVFWVPRSWSKKKMAAALSQFIFPTGKPDADNLLKCLDALNKIVFADDSQIVRATVQKEYGEIPQLVITISSIPGARR